MEKSQELKNPNEESFIKDGLDVGNEARGDVRSWIVTYKNGERSEFRGGWNNPNSTTHGLGVLVDDFERFLETDEKPPFPRRYRAYSSTDGKTYAILNVKLEDIVSILQLF